MYKLKIKNYIKEHLEISLYISSFTFNLWKTNFFLFSLS